MHFKMMRQRKELDLEVLTTVARQQAAAAVAVYKQHRRPILNRIDGGQGRRPTDLAKRRQSLGNCLLLWLSHAGRH